MKRLRNTFCVMSISVIILCGFVTARDEKYVSYFLHLYSAELYRDRNFVLHDSKAIFNKDHIVRIEMSFSCYKNLRLDDARKLICSVAMDLLEKVNSDPGLREKALVKDRLIPRQLHLRIFCDNAFGETFDTSYIREIILDRGHVSYITFDSIPEWWGQSTTYHEDFDYALMLVGNRRNTDEIIDQSKVTPQILGIPGDVSDFPLREYHELMPEAEFPIPKKEKAAALPPVAIQVFPLEFMNQLGVWTPPPPPPPPLPPPVEKPEEIKPVEEKPVQAPPPEAKPVQVETPIPPEVKPPEAKPAVEKKPEEAQVKALPVPSPTTGQQQLIEKEEASKNLLDGQATAPQPEAAPEKPQPQAPEHLLVPSKAEGVQPVVPPIAPQSAPQSAPQMVPPSLPEVKTEEAKPETAKPEEAKTEPAASVTTPPVEAPATSMPTQAPAVPAASTSAPQSTPKATEPKQEGSEMPDRLKLSEEQGKALLSSNNQPSKDSQETDFEKQHVPTLPENQITIGENFDEAEEKGFSQENILADDLNPVDSNAEDATKPENEPVDLIQLLNDAIDNLSQDTSDSTPDSNSDRNLSPPQEEQKQQDRFDEAASEEFSEPQTEVSEPVSGDLAETAENHADQPESVVVVEEEVKETPFISFETPDALSDPVSYTPQSSPREHLSYQEEQVSQFIASPSGSVVPQKDPSQKMLLVEAESEKAFLGLQEETSPGENDAIALDEFPDRSVEMNDASALDALIEEDEDAGAPSDEPSPDSDDQEDQVFEMPEEPINTLSELTEQSKSQQSSDAEGAMTLYFVPSDNQEVAEPFSEDSDSDRQDSMPPKELASMADHDASQESDTPKSDQPVDQDSEQKEEKASFLDFLFGSSKKDVSSQNDQPQDVAAQESSQESFQEPASPVVTEQVAFDQELTELNLPQDEIEAVVEEEQQEDVQQKEQEDKPAEEPKKGFFESLFGSSQTNTQTEELAVEETLEQLPVQEENKEIADTSDEEQIEPQEKPAEEPKKSLFESLFGSSQKNAKPEELAVDETPEPLLLQDESRELAEAADASDEEQNGQQEKPAEEPKKGFFESLFGSSQKNAKPEELAVDETSEPLLLQDESRELAEAADASDEEQNEPQEKPAEEPKKSLFESLFGSSQKNAKPEELAVDETPEPLLLQDESRELAEAADASDEEQNGQQEKPAEEPKKGFFESLFGSSQKNAKPEELAVDETPEPLLLQDESRELAEAADASDEEQNEPQEKPAEEPKKGFFESLFGSSQKNAKPEELAVDETPEPLLLQDESRELADAADASDEEQNEQQEKPAEEPKKGFFESLFGSSQKNAKTEEVAVVETPEELFVQDESKEIADDASASDEEQNEQQDKPAEEPKKGFFESLFGSSQKNAKTEEVAVVETPEELFVQDESKEIADDAGASDEEQNEQQDKPAEEPQKGFFESLFGSSQKNAKTEEVAVEETPEQPPVQDDSQEIADAADANDEEQNEQQEKPAEEPKKGFFESLFGSSQNNAKTEEVAVEETPEQPPVQDDSQEIADAADANDEEQNEQQEKPAEEPKKGFFESLFGSSQKNAKPEEMAVIESPEEEQDLEQLFIADQQELQEEYQDPDVTNAQEEPENTEKKKTSLFFVPKAESSKLAPPIETPEENQLLFVDDEEESSPDDENQDQESKEPPTEIVIVPVQDSMEKESAASNPVLRELYSEPTEWMQNRTPSELSGQWGDDEVSAIEEMEEIDEIQSAPSQEDKLPTYQVTILNKSFEELTPALVEPQQEESESGTLRRWYTSIKESIGGLFSKSETPTLASEKDENESAPEEPNGQDEVERVIIFTEDPSEEPLQK